MSEVCGKKPPYLDWLTCSLEEGHGGSCHDEKADFVWAVHDDGGTRRMWISAGKALRLPYGDRAPEESEARQK